MPARSRTVVAVFVVAVSVTVLFPAVEAPANAEVVVKRADGSTLLTTDDGYVWCSKKDTGVSIGGRKVPAQKMLRIAASNGARTTAALRGWEVLAIPGDIRLGRALRFPSSWTVGKERGAFAFAFGDGNEASSNDDGARGWVRFSAASCRIGRMVSFRIDATLDSEVGLPPLKIAGAFTGRVVRAPRR